MRDNWKGPETFRRAYRHVVDRVRARGATNIKWMFHTNNYSYPLDTWNFAPAYYPGSDYVDWLGHECLRPTIQGRTESRYSFAG